MNAASPVQKPWIDDLRNNQHSTRNDESLADSADLPPPDVIAQEIVDDLDAALKQFRLIAADLAST